MRTKLLLVLLVILAALWFAVKDYAYKSYWRIGAPVEAAAMDYSNFDHWATRPAELPPGAWAKPWGIDAFLVLPPPTTPAKHGLLPIDNDAVISAFAASLKNLNLAVPGETPVYAPFYRAPSPSSDIMVRHDVAEFAQYDLSTAFEHYLTEDNRGRGFFLLIAEDAKPFAAQLLARLQQDDTKSRFAGLIVFGEQDNSSLYKSIECADILEGACHQDVQTRGRSDSNLFFQPSLGVASTGTKVSDADGVANAIKTQSKTVSRWLDETQPKPAEPFFATQVIEIAPVYRVGETAPIETPEEEEGATDD